MMARGLKPKESDIRLEDREKVGNLFGEDRLRMVDPGEELSQAVFLERGGVEAWPVLIILAIVLLVAEQVVANKDRMGK